LSALLLSLLLAAREPAPNPGPPLTLALVVASNHGVSGRPDLQYADDDGAKYARVVSALAGAENTALVAALDRDTARLFPDLAASALPPNRAGLDAAGTALARRAAEARAEGRPVRLYFVFAGHGDVDQGRGFLELSDARFTADDLHDLLRAVDAAETHVILDSCNSYFVVNPRGPGARRVATPREAAESVARRLPGVGVFLSTSAEADVYEWSELQSGVFSHAVRSGLLGAADADRDGRVSYEELAAFVETAAAEIRNPQYRPRVYARGPDGEAGRSILELPRDRRLVLAVQEKDPVRLAVRDREGLRWLDAHQEAGAPLDLWLPASLGPGLEVERLRAGGGRAVEARYALAGTSGDRVALGALPLASGAPPESRGAGEIFASLFARPFGPQAVEGWRVARGQALEEEPEPPEEGAPSAALQARPASRRPIALYASVGYDFGFTRAVQVIMSDGSSRGLDANAGLVLALGVEALPVLDGRLRTRFTVGLKHDSISASNGNVDYLAFPVEALEVLEVGPARLGAGLSFSLAPKLSGSGVARDLAARLDPSLGFVGHAAWAWRTGRRGEASAGLRLLWQRLRSADTGAVVNANAVGAVAGFAW
jgi:hypothetical protein